MYIIAFGTSYHYQAHHPLIALEIQRLVIHGTTTTRNKLVREVHSLEDWHKHRDSHLRHLKDTGQPLLLSSRNFIYLSLLSYSTTTVQGVEFQLSTQHE